MQRIETNKISCVFIGEDILSAACIEYLLSKGGVVVGLCATSKELVEWANRKNIKTIPTIEDISSLSNSRPFDYLFSIGNKKILSDQILSLPKKLTINFHNAPLPKYAGAHPTSWAILNEEKSFGITWHIMSNIIDGGDILKQKFVKVDDNDTTVTLNIKCYDAAIKTFKDLVEDLSKGNITKTQQDLLQKSYFTSNLKPLGNGIISWNKSAKEIYCLFRALNFGKNNNCFAVSKIKIGHTFFIVHHLELSSVQSLHPPGTVIDCCKQYIQVSTTTNDVLVKKLSDLYGNDVPIKQIIKHFNLKPYNILEIISDNDLLKVQKFAEKTFRYEQFWSNTLLNQKENILDKLMVPIIRNNFNKKIRYSMSDDINCDKLICLGKNDLYQVLTLILIYFYRLNNYENYTVNIKIDDHDMTDSYENLYETHIPLTTNFNSNNNFYVILNKLNNIIQKIQGHKTFSKDLIFRNKQLKDCLKNKFLSITITDDLHSINEVSEAVVSLFVHRTDFKFRTLIKKSNCTPIFLKNLLSHIKTLEMSIYQNPHRSVKELQILSSNEYKKVVQKWNNTDACHIECQSILELFEMHVNKNPLQIAIQFYEQDINYATLNKRTNKLANYLLEIGIQAGDLVCILMNKSIDMIVAVLATLKVGATYVPIDVKSTYSVNKYIIDDCKARFFITNKETINEKLVNDSSNKFAKIITVDGEEELEIEKKSDVSPIVNICNTNSSYVIYTSGTTGISKGVEVTHQSLINLVQAMKQQFSIDNSTKILLFSSFSFDGSVWEIFSTLMNGATLCIAHEQDLLPGEPLIQTLRNYEISLVVLPASVLKILRYVELPYLEVLLSVGESCTEKIVKDWADKVTLINGYGPTESTVCTTLAICNPNSSCKCIGKPIHNAKVYILDIFNNPMPIGIPGEINIGGKVLAKGYFQKKDMTQQSFILDPFNGMGKNYIYKTGDLGHFSSNGNIYYYGRIDTQVKIRGFRIELDFVETILRQHQSINDCVVNVKTINNNKILVAYVVLNKELQVNSYDLKEYLKKYLPTYMIPTSFLFIEKIPINKNGKIEIKDLPLPKEVHRAELTLYVKPRTDIEKKLEDIWKKLLSLDKVGVYDDFFQIGGHSLLIAQLFLMVNTEFHASISIHDFLKQPNINFMSQLILTTNKTNNIVSEPVNALPLIDLKEGLSVINRIKIPSDSIITTNTNVILLTGFTGFIGKYILYNICASSHLTAEIYCLMRDNTIEKAQERIEEILKSNLFKDFTDDLKKKIIPILGDLSKPFLGMKLKQFEMLSKKINIIYHIGAYVNHLYNYEQLRDINVIGTLELIKFAMHNKIKKINYISTLSVITQKQESDLAGVFEVVDGYSQTKWVSEELLKYSRVVGLPVDIFRLGWVLWDKNTDVKAIKNNHLYSLINVCVQLGYAPNWKTKLNLISVEFLSKFVVLSGLEKTTSQRIFNMVSPNTVKWSYIISVFSRGMHVTYISPEQWHKKILLHFSSKNIVFPFLPIYFDAEKSIRLKSPDLTFNINHDFTDRQLKNLKMEYPIVKLISLLDLQDTSSKKCNIIEEYS